MRTTTRFTYALTLALGGVFAVPADAIAQNSMSSRFELRPFAGMFVPTGARRDLLKTGATVGAQAAASLHKNVSVVGSFGYTSSDVRGVTPNIHMYQYDLGAEFGSTIPFTPKLSLRPFVGAGAGGRTYDYRNIQSDAQHNLAGYVSTGGELQVGRYAFRTELRDYVSGFKGLGGQRVSSGASNDLSLTTGISVRF